jgi:hypothetical protein
MCTAQSQVPDVIYDLGGLLRLPRFLRLSETRLGSSENMDTVISYMPSILKGM